MGNRLKDKVAVITGGARGIGWAIAELFAKEGARVVISDVNEPLLKEAQEKVRLLGSEALGVKSDVTDSAQAEEMVKKTVDKFGKINILVNNAGITKDSLLIRMSDADWDAVLAVNLKGAFLCSRAASKVMIKQRYGKIINIASIVGIRGNAGQANYAASKGGLIALTKTLAKELGSRNVLVNAIAPGFIRTDMTDKLSEDSQNSILSRVPLNRFGEAADVAKAALFLAGEESDYVTGAVLQVDGGIVM